MLIYEVNLHVDGDVREDFSIWLEQHLRDMMGTGCFSDAKAYEEQGGDFVCHYFCNSREILDEYFEKYSEKMRADGQQLFAEKFKATRRILKAL